MNHIYFNYLRKNIYKYKMISINSNLELNNKLEYTKKENENKRNISEESTSSFEETQSDEEEISTQKQIRNCELSKEITSIIETLIDNNKKNKRRKITKDIFTGRTIPKINLNDYINRIIAYTKIEKNNLICSLIYLDEIDKKKPITEFNIHRIFFTAILISIKYNEDDIFKNDYYSQISGVTLTEINKMEYTFISLLDFNLYINPSVFEKYQHLL